MIHSQIPGNTIPQIGIEFETIEEAFDFYNAYAYKIGFNVRKSKTYTNKHGRLVYKLFCCSYEGFCEKDRRDVFTKVIALRQDVSV